MFKCNCCGELFEEPKILHESRGEYWGMPCYENIAVSPCCEEDFTEGKMYHAEGKVYAFIDDEMTEVADFEGEYFAEDDGESLYDEIYTEQVTKYYHRFGEDIDIDIETYWEE